MPILSFTRRVAGVFLLVVASVIFTSAQSVLLNGPGVSDFPVTNKLNIDYNIYINQVTISQPLVYGVAPYQSRYYIFGNFTDIVQNRGSIAIQDTLTHMTISDPKANVRGLVKTVISDGNGGYYIGGNFSNIGDSVVSSLAHVDSHGLPLQFPLHLTGTVNALLLRNDTLFIGGSSLTDLFTSFIMYSIKGDSLIQSKTFRPFTQMAAINAFLIRQDTLIVGGAPYGQEHGLQKYNFRDFKILPWFSTVLYQTYNSLSFNPDSTVIVTEASYNGDRLLGLSYSSGAQIYSRDLSGLNQVAVLGNKGFAGGTFNSIQGTTHKGLFCFNASTGEVLPDDLQLDGYVTFLAARQDRIFISGKFSNIRGRSRENFAELNGDALDASAWQLSPSDPITAIGFSGPNAYVAGIFSGVNSVHRNGFAAIDSATNQVLPWSPANTAFVGMKRMLFRGDSLFVLGFTSLNNSCVVNDYTASLKIYGLSTGAELYSSSSVDDIVLDGSYAYISSNHELSRYHLPEMTKDIVWGTNWNGSGGDHIPTWLTVSSDKIYEIGDNRYNSPCTADEKVGYFTIYDKTAGHIQSVYTYKGNDPRYDPVVFEHSLLLGNKLYIQGYFNSLNGKPRTDLACIDVSNGTLTDWSVTFGDLKAESLPLNVSSQLHLFRNSIWLGTDITTVGGLIDIDTSTGGAFPASAIRFSADRQTGQDQYVGYPTGVKDMFINDKGVLIAGGFDSTNESAHTNLAKYELTFSDASISACENGAISARSSLTGAIYQWQVNKGGGFVNLSNDSIISGVNAPTLNITHIPQTWNGALLRCLADSYSGKVYDLKITPSPDPNITIQPSATAVCSGGPVTFKAIPTNGGINPGYTWLINNIEAPVTGDTFHVFILKDRDSVKVVMQSSATCISKLRDTSAAVSITINANAEPKVTISGTGDSCNGRLLSFAAISQDQGANPQYQWRKNGATVGSSPTYSSKTLSDGDSVSLLLTSSATCAVPATVTSNTVRVHLLPIAIPAISISGDTNISLGNIAIFHASTVNGGNKPLLQWQDSSDMSVWKNISSGNDSTLNYNPDRTNIRLRCLIMSNASCASPTTASSNLLNLTIISQAAAPDTLNARIYPNPVHDQLIIDDLAPTEDFSDLLIVGMDGRIESGPIPISNQTRIKLNISTLTKGFHIAILHRKSGSSVYLKFLKL